jgi:hypothetical protein
MRQGSLGGSCADEQRSELGSWWLPFCHRGGRKGMGRWGSDMGRGGCHVEEQWEASGWPTMAGYGRGGCRSCDARAGEEGVQ